LRLCWILAKLTPAEFERVANIVEHSPDRFPLGTLTALKDWSAAPAPEAPATVSTDVPPNRAGRSSFATERLRLNRSRGFGRFRAGVPQGVTEKSGTGTGTRPGTRVQTAQRRFEVAKLMKLGLSVRTISAGTDIPATSVHRAMRAIARAEAKREAAMIEIMRKILGKKQS
jgi:hypothetical protein